MEGQSSGLKKFFSTRAGKWAIGGAVVLILGMIGSLNGKPSGSSTNQSNAAQTNVATQQPVKISPAKLTMGQQGVLTLAGLPTAYLAKDKDSYSALGKALTIKDDYAVVQLLQGGKIFEATKGSKVLVIDSTLTSLEVRILDGTESVGEAGWLPYEWVSSQ